jgi:aryl-alcohol dehydrogenase-like predicted oxidoreductase
MTTADRSLPALALGTVQFGLDYGITNQAGKPSLNSVIAILAAAAGNGIDLLDTASAYGNSEKVLGTLSEQAATFSIITKTPSWNGAPPEECGKELMETFEASQRHLKRATISGLMVHFAMDLAHDRGTDIWQSLRTIQAAGKAKNIGISFYADDPIDALVAKFKPDFVQLPVSILDQRLVSSGQIRRLHDAGIEIHARSVFLQGLLLSSRDNLPEHLKPLASSLQKFRKICHDAGLSQLEGALSFVRSIKELSRIVVGVTTSGELEAICHAFTAVAQTSLDWRPVGFEDPRCIDPRFWPKQ